jgi:hypothetical protein
LIGTDTAFFGQLQNGFGFGEIDTLTGGTNDDTFVLGLAEAQARDANGKDVLVKDVVNIMASDLVIKFGDILQKPTIFPDEQGIRSRRHLQTAGSVERSRARSCPSEGNTLVQNARLFALLNIAQADAGIVAWDAKYTYEQLRPITAIQEADKDNNPDTIADPNWEPLLDTPPFPQSN